MTDFLYPGDTYEILEDCVITSREMPSGSRGAGTVSTYEAREGDVITYLGPREIGKHGPVYYKFIYSPSDDEGNIIGVDYPVYVKNVVKLFESIGYEVE